MGWPYPEASFDAGVCVDVLEHVQDLPQGVAEIARVLKPGGMFLYDTINRGVLARLAAITLAEDVVKILPKGTHDPALFIRPKDLADVMEKSGLEVGPTTGLGPRGINRRGDLIFGPLPSRAVIYMGLATKPG